VFDNSSAVSQAYGSLMCFEGYTGRLCSTCLFPGPTPDTAYGQYYSGCGLCPPWGTAMAAYVLSRAFDIAIVGLRLILTTLSEMKKRRASVLQARHSAILAAGSQQQQHQQQQQPPPAAAPSHQPPLGGVPAASSLCDGLRGPPHHAGAFRGHRPAACCCLCGPSGRDSQAS